MAEGIGSFKIKQYGQKLILQNPIIQNSVHLISNSLNSPYLSIVALQLKSLNVTFNSFERNVHFLVPDYIIRFSNYELI